jgi:hypothetical protein
MLPLKNPLFVTTKSATSNTNNSKKLVLQVSAYFQYVSHIAACKYNFVLQLLLQDLIPQEGPAQARFGTQIRRSKDLRASQ